MEKRNEMVYCNEQNLNKSMTDIIYIYIYSSSQNDFYSAEYCTLKTCTDLPWTRIGGICARLTEYYPHRVFSGSFWKNIRLKLLYDNCEVTIMLTNNNYIYVYRVYISILIRLLRDIILIRIFFSISDNNVKKLLL